MLRYGTDPTAAALAVSGRGSGEKEGIASQRDANNFLKARGSNLAKYMRENGLGKGDPIYIGDLLAKYGFKPATDEELNRPATGSMIALPAPKPRQPAASPRRIKNR
jgi:hypothetical protein